MPVLAHLEAETKLTERPFVPVWLEPAPGLIRSRMTALGREYERGHDAELEHEQAGGCGRTR